MRICKLESCQNQLPENTRWNQKFCSEKCYRTQNGIEAKIKGKAKYKALNLGTRICAYGKCGKEFKIDGKKTQQKYCSPECKRQNALYTQRVKRNAKRANSMRKCIDCGINLDNYSARCETCEYVHVHEKKKEKKRVNPMYLVRGRKHYEGIGRLS